MSAVANAESSALSQSSRMRSILSACAGNLVEWFDFFVYAYTAIYFASLFFPSGDQTSQLLSTAGVFAVGFLMRPVGGWVFGWIADTKGRKLSMVLSVLMMCTGSLIIAVLPTYASIGVAAPALLVFARLLQGLSVGAEYGTGATYICEVSTAGRRGFLGSFQYLTIVAGQLLALLVILLLQALMPAPDLKAWGWRIPFIVGACGAVVALYLRRSMMESANERARHANEAGSVLALGKHKRAVTLTLIFTAFGSLNFYLFTSYMQKFLVVSAGLSAQVASVVMTTALVLFMLAQPLFGALADRIGIKIHMLIFTGLSAVCVVPLLTALQLTSNPVSAFSLVFAGLLITAFYTPIAGLLKADMFPAAVRALGVGLPYAIANAAFGGTAEYVALYLRASGVERFFFYYVAGMAAIAFVAALMMPNLHRHGYLDGDGEVEANIGRRRVV